MNKLIFELFINTSYELRGIYIYEQFLVTIFLFVRRTTQGGLRSIQ